MSYAPILAFGLVFALLACGPETEMTGQNATRKAVQTERTKGKTPKIEEEPEELPGDLGTGPTSFRQSYEIHERETISFGFDPATELFEQKLTQIRRTEPRTVNLAQTDRPSVVKLFKQGTPGTTKTETFSQAQTGLLDIQVVIDNSGSMSEEQTNLGTKLAALITSIKDRNWRINVVTTDPQTTAPPAKTCSRAIINRGDANADTVFRAAVNAGTSGSGNERGILMAVEGLKCATTPWVRPGSKVAVLIVADEDNCSNGSGCGSDPWGKPDYLLSYLRDTMNRPLGTDARVYGIYWIPGTTCKSGGYVANQYAQAVAQSGGTAGSICDADYTSTLQRISSDVAAILKNDYALAATPDAGSVKVYVDGVLKTSGYAVSGKVVSFTQPPAEGATIKVQYTVGASPVVKSFALGEMPATDTLTVMVNGATVAKNAYAFDAQTKAVVFNTAPAADAEIKATFRTGGALGKTFDLGATPKAGSLSIKLNGAPTTAYVVSAQKLTFDLAPADGTNIEAKFTADLGPLLTYPVTFIGSEILGLMAVDAATGDSLDVSYESGAVTFPVDAFAENREVKLIYHNESALSATTPLPRAPIYGSLEVTGLPCSGDDVVHYDDQSLTLACDLTGIRYVEVRYSALREIPTQFTLDAYDGIQPGIWQVDIDGEPADDFTTDGNTVTLPAPPAGGSTVTLTFLTDSQ